MDKHEISGKDCTIFQYLDLLSKKWTLFLMVTFWKNPQKEFKFSEFEKMMPDVTSRIISIRLKELIEFELIEKINIKSNKSVYKLTPKGEEIKELYNNFQGWIHKKGLCKCNKTCIYCKKI